MGPDATPPESKAMAVYISGTKKDSTIAIIYPGTRNHKIDIPVSTRKAEIPIATAIAADRLSFIARPGIAPALTVSICFSSTATAGSADMINHPSHRFRHQKELSKKMFLLYIRISEFFQYCQYILSCSLKSSLSSKMCFLW